MPSSVERALADALSLEHPDIAWSPPANLPSASDLQASLRILDAQAAPATLKHVTWCLAKLMMAFEPNVKSSGEETKLRAAVWLEACGDLGDELWSKATLAAIQSSKWMPKPAEFRKFVERELETRAKNLKRCKAMLAAHGSTNPDKPFEPASEESRLQQLRDSLRKIGKDSRAAVYERELARREGREPEAWVTNPDEKSDNPVDRGPPPPPLSPGMQQRTLRSLAKAYRAKGYTTQAERLEFDADIIAVPDEAPNAYKGGMPAYERELDTTEHYRDIPEGNAA